jgi:homocysteine S-methyltransferase
MTLFEGTAGVLLTDSGIETDIIFGDGRELNAFAVFPLLMEPEGREILRAYYLRHLSVAAQYGLGYVLETPTWRSSRDWGLGLGYTQEQLDAIDREAVAFVRAMRAEAPIGLGVSPISGNIGPRGDGYAISDVMTVAQALAYHGHQVGLFADAGCDLVSGCTFTYAAEAIGLAAAAREHGVPCVIYFTVETDGCLPDGSTLAETIDAVDSATDGYVSYFGLNCAHPDHMTPAIEVGAPWVGRIGAIRANASRMSHAELDEAEVLDDGDPAELALDLLRLRGLLPQARVFGGCCGTDVRHVRALAAVITP